MRGSFEMRGPRKLVTSRARALRQVDNDAEDALWSELRDHRLNGYKFVRQYPIKPYFADFACRKHHLVVELDGSQHADSDYDKRRDSYLVEKGWSVIRFWNIDALKERDAVVETILAALEGSLDREIDANDLKFRASWRYGWQG